VRASFAASFALALALGIRDVRRIEAARPAMVRRIREDAEREHWLTSVWWWRIGLVCAAAAPFAKKTTPIPFLLMMPLALKLTYTLLDWLSRILFGHRFVPLMRGVNPLSVRGSDWILSLVLWTASVGLAFGLDRLSTSWLGVPLLLETVSTR
jgi:hypothetical protein